MEVTRRAVLCVLCVLSGAPAVRGQSTNVSQITTEISPQSKVESAVPLSPSTPLLRASTGPEPTTVKQSSLDPLKSTTGPLDPTSFHTTLLPQLQEASSNHSSNSGRSSDALTVGPYTTRQPAHLVSTSTPLQQTAGTPATTDPKRSSTLDVNSTDKDSGHPTSEDFSTPTPLTHRTTSSIGLSLSPTSPNTPSTTAAPAYVDSTTTSQLIFTSSPVGPNEEGPSLLNVGDDVPVLLHSRAPLDPLLAALLSVFIVIGAIVSLFLFLKFRQHSERPEFHRLQDLPMDDMMEDTPLSRYSY